MAKDVKRALITAKDVAANRARFLEGSKAPPVLYHGTHADISSFKKKRNAHLGFHFGDVEAANNRLEDTADRAPWDKADLAERAKNSGDLFDKWKQTQDALRRKNIEVPHQELADALENNQDIGAVFKKYEYVPTPEEAANVARLEQDYKKSQMPIFKFGKGANIGKYHVAIKKPLRMPDVKNWGSLKEIKKHLPFDTEARTHGELINDLKARGYDGIVYQNAVENPVMRTDSYIAFEPTQIKSAIGNRGTFDPNEADISKAEGGSATKRALMIARDQRNLLRRIANIYPGPAGGMDPSPGGGGYSGPGGGKYIGPSHYADGGGVDDYGGGHRPPGPDGGAPLHDLTANGTVYPDDVYGPQGARFYGTGDASMDRQTLKIAHEARGKPEAQIPVFRAVPKTAGDTINHGDWVTTNPAYARAHGESALRGKYKIIGKTVRADEVFTNGDSLHEYGYWSRHKRADGGSVPPFKLQSGAAKLIAQKGQAKATPQQYAAMPGIKPDELKHSKFDTLGSKALPREEVIKHLEDNAVPLEETQLGGEGRNTSPKFDNPKHQLAGGQNYREVLLHTPAAHTPSPELEKARARAEAATRAFDDALNDQLSSPNNADDEAYRRASAEVDAARIALARLERADKSAASNAGFRGGHWDQPNVLAHLRMSDRRGPNGEKILHLEEAQSDWGQKGRDRGFSNPEVANRQKELFQELNDTKKAHVEAQRDVETKHKLNLREFDAAYKAAMSDAESKFNASRMNKSDIDAYNEASDLALAKTQHLLDPAEKIRQEAHKQIHTAFAPKIEALEKEFSALPKHGDIPQGPYVDNTQKWTDLALKRVLHEAAHGGYDKIVVTPGDEQNKRYDLSAQVKNIHYFPDTGYLHATTHDDEGVDHENVKPEELAKHIGKEAADRILKQPVQRYEGRGKLGGEFYHELEGNDLKMGGAGMRGYYDNILPKRLQALAQQHDPQAKVQLGSTPVADDTAPLHSLDVTPQMRDSIKANGFNSFKRGGEVDDDPIKDWQWRPTEDVRNELQLDEIPSHVHKFGEFMDETARRAATQGLTPRDLIKAYAITRSSIGRGALPVSTVRRPKNPAYGFDALPEDTQGSLRPEGAMGHWLHTKMGQRYLDEAEAGRVDEEAVRDAIKSMGAFGLPDTAEGKALRWAPKNLPGHEGRVSELIARAHRGQSSPEEWRGEMRVPGIAESKAGFFASMLGRGDQPTLDARQIILNTGQSTKKAAPYLSPKGAKEAAVNRLTGRQTELGLKHDKSMSPFYQHLAHHTIWDKVGNEQTTHDDLMQALRGAKDGGRQGYASGGPTNILGHPVARALITALGPNWVNPLDEAAQAAGMVPDELAHKLRMRTGDKGDKLSKLAPQTDWAAHSVKLARAILDPIQRIDPHEIAKNRGTFIAGPGDRQITDAEIHGLNGIEFATPVRGHGGPFYPRGEAGRKGAAWASAQGPVSKQLGMAESAERLGSTPYHVPWSMSRGAVDSTPMMWELIANLLPHAKINKTSRAMIDRSIRSHVIDKEGTRPFRGAPSIASEDFPKWVGAMGLGERYALMNALEKTSHIVKGFPEPAALRLAITEPEYVAPRSLTAGRVITQIDPKAGIIHDPEVPHPGYPKQFMKKGAVMGFERPAPLGLMFPKAWKTIAGDLDPEVAAVPNNVNRAFQMSNIYQPVTNEVADNLAAYFEREKGKPFKKGGGRVGHAPGGIVSRALDIARKINGR